MNVVLKLHGREFPYKQPVLLCRQEMAYPFIAVHAGAGYHSDSNGTKLKDLCKTACLKTMAALREGRDAAEGVAIAVSELESSPLTNSGLGSNLSLTGQVECDASVMDGDGGFGSVGALQGVVNPIQVSLEMLRDSSHGTLSLGRVPPLMLTGEGGRLWAEQRGCGLCQPDELITDRAREVYLDHKSRLDGASSPAPKHRKRRREDNGHNKEEPPLDTVGAICLDGRGGVAGGVSSGGISLKFPGRVGQAAVFGCGCWAQHTPSKESRAVACSTSGTGEYIIKTMLAKECAESMIDSSLEQSLTDKFLRSERLSSVDQRFKLAGVIALNLTTDGDVHFSWGHTTESMCVGYMSHTHQQPTAVLSKMADPDKAGLTTQVEALKLSPS